MADNRFRTPSRTELFQSMKTSYEQYYLDGETAITDLSEGSEIGTLLNSIAVEMEALYLHDALLCDQKFVKTATGSFLDLLACENHLSRHQGSYASVECTFALVGNIQTKDMIIPEGTAVIHRKNGLRYILESKVKIPAGAKSATGKVVAEFPGTQYNTTKGMLTAFESVSQYANEVSVINYSDVTNGTDTETDAELRARILSSRRNLIFGSIGWYKSQLESIEGVHDVALLNPNNPHIDHSITNGADKPDTCTDCTRVVYVNAKKSSLDATSTNAHNANFDNILFNVTAWLENQNNTVIGHKFHVEPAVQHPFYLEIYAYDNGKPTEEELREVLNAYFDGGTFTDGTTNYVYPGLNIHDTVRKGELIDALEKIPCIEQIDSIYQLKFNQHIEGDVKSIADKDETRDWERIPQTNLWEFVDDTGFTFEAKNVGSVSTPSVFDWWGRRTFIQAQVDDDEYAYLGDMTDEYDSIEDSQFEHWYTKWSDVWYDPNYTSIIYHSLGRASRDDGYYTDNPEIGITDTTTS